MVVFAFCEGNVLLQRCKAAASGETSSAFEDAEKLDGLFAAVKGGSGSGTSGGSEANLSSEYETKNGISAHPRVEELD